METGGIEGAGGFRFVSKLILCAISGALTGCFAIAGALTGAIAGALAAKASKSSFFRGASLGAIAGAIISVEVFEASRAYWCMERTGSRGASSMADFIEELVRGRLVEESLAPVILTAYNLQVGIANTGYDEIHDVPSLVASRGLSGDSLKKLPHHVVLKDMKAENTCCAICLQDLEVGEIARSLPGCQHTFHLICVDKWLVRNDSCPVCRQGKMADAINSGPVITSVLGEQTTHVSQHVWNGDEDRVLICRHAQQFHDGGVNVPPAIAGYLEQAGFLRIAQLSLFQVNH